MNSSVLRMRATAMTHHGKVRSNNEDCIGAFGWVRSVTMRSPISIECQIDEPRLCVVADGLGGQAAGEIASAMAVRGLVQAASKFNGEGDIGLGLADVNQRIYDAMGALPELRGMGSTVVGLGAFGSQVCLFNVGDSRGYLMSGSYLRLLSIDHTSGFDTVDVSERTGQRGHRITQSLGGLSTFTPINPHLVLRTAEPGDRYLLCSDGLTDMLDLDAIERCLEEDPYVSVERLLEAALFEGGEDNTSVIIVDFLSS